MKRVFFILIALLSSAAVYAQVYDYTFENRDAFQTFPQLKPVSESLQIKSMPLFNVDSLLAENREMEGLDVPFRFGYGFDVDYTLADGKWTEEGDSRIWRSRFYSKGAYSINFEFSEMTLSPEAELYIFSSDGSMVYGPVTENQNIKTGKYLTGLVAGDDVVIQLIEPAASTEKSRLRISRVVHGYVNSYPGLNPEGVTLLNCHNSVCGYPTWKDQSDAVCLTYIGDSYWCSGSLLNNTGQNFKPYFLTAYHCLTSDVTSWAFRFQHKDPACSTSSIYYNGCHYRAGWEDTDFLLLELQQIVFNERLTFLGWDRSSSASSTGTGIHHPQGATMKISFDEDALISSGNFWQAGFDNGTAEHGSSGSPLFNTAQRVIGQLYGGPQVPTCPPITVSYGRFDKSWTGGGTSATRLSDWLAPSGSATTTDLIRFEISGPSLVPCSGTVTYSLPATTAASYTVTWDVGSLQLVSGQGTKTVTVQRPSSSTVASAIVKATLTYTGGSSVIQKPVDIGSPHITSLSGPSSAKVGSSNTFTAQPSFPTGQGEYQWTVTPGTATVTPHRQTCSIIFNASGGYLVGVRSTSTCIPPGSYTTTTVSVSSSYMVSSGTGKQVTVGLANGATAAANQTIAYSLHNPTTGALAASGRIAAQGGTLDFGNLPAGIYILSLDTDGGNPDIHKIVLK
jgi:hypothetical protein